MKNEAKIKLAKKKKENEEAKRIIVSEAHAITAYTKQRKEELDQIKQSIEALASALNVNVEYPDIESLLKKLDNLEHLPDSFTDIKNMSLVVSNKLQILTDEKNKKQIISVRGFAEANKRWENIDKNIDKFAQLPESIDALTEKIKQGQNPDDYKPVRIVIGGDGIPLKFLKDMPVSRGGGGGGSSSSSSVGLTDTELRASPVPVSGTFYQATQPVSNAGLTELAAAIDTEVQVDVVGALPAGNNNIGDVDVASSALPSGASTSAKQDTAQASFDAIKTATETIDNAISGNEMQVDVLTMPTTTVQATNLDIRDLTSASDSIAVTDGGGSITVDGSLTANPTAPTTLVTFVQTIDTAGTEEQLPSNAISAGIVQAPSTNTGVVYIGNDNTVSSSNYGAELQPGQASGIAISNTNKIWADVSVSGDKIAFMGS